MTTTSFTVTFVIPERVSIPTAFIPSGTVPAGLSVGGVILPAFENIYELGIASDGATFTSGTITITYVKRCKCRSTVGTFPMAVNPLNATLIGKSFSLPDAKVNSTATLRITVTTV